MERVIEHLKDKCAEANLTKIPKETMVVEINKIYRAPGGSCFNLARFNEDTEQYKAKFYTMRMLKFDPFVIKCTVAGWPKSSSNSYGFYKNK